MFRPSCQTDGIREFTEGEAYFQILNLFFYDQVEQIQSDTCIQKERNGGRQRRRRRRGGERVGRGEGQSAALHNKDLGIGIGILHTHAGYYLFLHMSFQPIPPGHASWRSMSNSFKSQSERISFLFKPVIMATQCKLSHAQIGAGHLGQGI